MVSLIIPIYNRAHLIEETLQSIMTQTFINWECIIIDDGSTDNTIDVIKAFTKKDERFKVHKRPVNIQKGPSACRNYAVSISKGNYIQFFDSDDIMHPDHLRLKVDAIKDQDIVVCKLKQFSKVFTDDLFLEDRDEVLILPEKPFEAFATGQFEMMMVAPLWKKKTLQKFLPIREDLHLLEDHELHARALSSDLDIVVINKSLIYYRVDLQSSTNNFYKDLNTGLWSYLEAKSTVLGLSESLYIKLAILKNVLGYFRAALAMRNFEAANTCLHFIAVQKLTYNFNLKMKIKRITFFFNLFKIVKKGDTFFKPLFKL